MKKRILALFLLVVLLLSTLLTACNNGESVQTSKGDQETIKIGFLGNLDKLLKWP